MGAYDSAAQARAGILDLKTAISTLALAALAYCVIKISKAVWVGFTGPLSKVPGPWLNRLTGIPWIAAVIKGRAFEAGINYSKQYGDIVRVAPDLVLVSDAKSIHRVLVADDLRKSIIYEKFRQDPEAASMFTLRDRAKYRTRRRLLSHGFSVSYLKGLEPLFLKCIKVVEGVLDEKCTRANGEKAVVDAWSLMGCTALDIMSESAFGGSFEMVKNGEHPIRKKNAESMRRMAIYQLLPFLMYMPFMTPFQDPELRKLVDEIIERRRSSDKKLAKPDILQLLLDTHDQNPDEFTYNEVIAEMFLFILAGSETTGVTMTFALMYLLNDPPAYNRAAAEIRERFPHAGSPVTDDLTLDLPYLNAVIKETMRLKSPAAAGLYRQTDEDIILNDYLIPAGTRVTANTTVLHYDEREWPDAGEFVPERWLSEYKGVKANEKTAWYPFSAGSRNCIGKQFAMSEMRLILASLIRRYDLFLVPGQSHEVVSHTVIQLKAQKYMVSIKPRA